MTIASVDLHIHTYYSDGKYSPAEILQQAAKLGIKTLAITDHDNTRGVREALPLAQELGLVVIPAIEVTCSWPACHTAPGEGDIDLLGYFVDLDDPVFELFEASLLDDLYARIADCCDLLTMDGYWVNVPEVLMENPRYPGLLPLIRVLQHKYRLSWEDAFAVMFEQWKRVRLSRLTLADAIANIHLAGGVAVLAHPSVVKCDGLWLQPEQLENLAGMGLDGLEIYHYRLDDDARAYFSRLAEQFDLLKTGGSDLHGWSAGMEYLGTQAIPGGTVAALRARRDVRRGRIGGG